MLMIRTQRETSAAFAGVTAMKQQCRSKMTDHEKREILRKEARCFRCTAKGHRSKDCQRRISCSKCQRRHASSLCCSRELVINHQSLIRIKRTTRLRTQTETSSIARPYCCRPFVYGLSPRSDDASFALSSTVAAREVFYVRTSPES